MARIESIVTIARPVEEVFQFLLDLDKNLLSADSDVESVVKTPDGPTAPGTTVRIRQKVLGRTAESVTRFTAVERDRKKSSGTGASGRCDLTRRSNSSPQIERLA